MHIEMQKETFETTESESIEPDSDTSSLISSTSGVESMSHQLIKRIDDLNERKIKIEESLRAKQASENNKTPLKTEQLSVKQQPTNKHKLNDVDTLEDFLTNSSMAMQEITLDDDILTPSYTPSSSKENSPMQKIQQKVVSPPRHQPHVCPHKTANLNDKDDRNSPYPMIEVNDALKMIFKRINKISEIEELKSPINLPPFRASIKDGYAVKSASKNKFRKVIGNINAGDKIVQTDFDVNSCYKINTGAPVPNFSDSILQIEDTKLTKTKSDGAEDEIEVLKFPNKNLDIREVGSDLLEGETLFTTSGIMGVAEHSILASVGIMKKQKMPKIGIISTGDELADPKEGELREGQIYDSNSTMLKLLIQKFGFEVSFIQIAKDNHSSLKGAVQSAMKTCDVIISSGGVSMGDKDFVKPLMKELGFEIVFGRVNMKPGKPMTFATNGKNSYFALPGNPVSAYVTFHLFVLPSLRFMCGFPKAKCFLPEINVILQIDKYTLDPRPEYARGRVTYNKENGLYYASMHENQMSSRLASLINSDVLLHLPGATTSRPTLNKEFKLKATIIDMHFISGYCD
jgi:gephyrin